jgi:hypothetical protein
MLIRALIAPWTRHPQSRLFRQLLLAKGLVESATCYQQQFRYWGVIIDFTGTGWCHADHSFWKQKSRLTLLSGDLLDFNCGVLD